MIENNKYFQAVTISLILHLALLFLLSQIHTPQPQTRQAVTVEIQEQEQKKETFVSKKLLSEKYVPKTRDFKKTPFLGQLEQRVERELISPNIGNPQNQTAKFITKNIQLKASKSSGDFLGTRKDQEFSNYTSDLESQFNLDLKKIKQGTITLLNTDYSTFASFYDRISPVVRYQWLKGISDYLSDPVVVELMKLNKDAWITRIEIQLDKNGNFLKSFVVNSSGSIPLDQAALDAFKKSTPFINPPTAMVESDGKIHINAQFLVILNPRYFARSK